MNFCLKNFIHILNLRIHYKELIEYRFYINFIGFVKNKIENKKELILFYERLFIEFGKYKNINKENLSEYFNNLQNLERIGLIDVIEDVINKLYLYKISCFPSISSWNFSSPVTLCLSPLSQGVVEGLRIYDVMGRKGYSSLNGKYRPDFLSDQSLHDFG